MLMRIHPRQQTRRDKLHQLRQVWREKIVASDPVPPVEVEATKTVGSITHRDTDGRSISRWSTR